MSYGKSDGTGRVDVNRALIVAALAAFAVAGGLLYWIITPSDGESSLEAEALSIDADPSHESPSRDAEKESRTDPSTPSPVVPPKHPPTAGVAFVVRVLDTNRQPLAGAVMTTPERSATRGSWTTDAAGEAKFDYEMDGRIVMLKTEDGRIVARFLEPQRGVAVLYGGAPILPPFGRVELNGRPASEPITIRMFESDPTVSSSENELDAVTTDNGRFAFKKSPTNFARLRVDGSYFDIHGQAFQCEIGTSTGELVLELTRGPTISGRVVREPDLLPAKNVKVRLSARGDVPIATMTDGEGRFRLQATRWIKAGQVTISDRDDATVRVALPTDIKLDHDVGEIILRLRTRIDLRVYGPDGRPVRGAIAAWREDPDIVSKPTDESGTTEIEPLFGARELVVGAFGFRATVITGDPNGWNSDLVANLEASAIVHVTIKNSDPKLSPIFPLSIEATGSMFSPGPLPSAVAAALFSKPDDVTTGNSQMQIGVAIRDEIAFSGLVEGGLLRLTLGDQLGALKMEETVVPGPSGRHDVVFEITQPLQQLIVQVSAADRPRVAKARVRLSLGPFDVRTPWQMTDESGRAEFAVLARRVRIDVAHNDYLEVVQESCRLTGDQTIKEVKLDSKRDLTITVVDDDGTPISDAQVSAHSDRMAILLRAKTFEAKAAAIGNGQYTLAELPIGTITVEANLRGQKVEIQHPTNNSKLKIVMTQRGQLEIECRTLPDERARYFVQIVHLEAEKIEKIVPIEFSVGRRRVARIEQLRPGPWRVELFTAASIDAPERQSVCIWNRVVVAADQNRRLVLPVKDESAPADRR